MGGVNGNLRGNQNWCAPMILWTSGWAKGFPTGCTIRWPMWAGSVWGAITTRPPLL